MIIDIHTHIGQDIEDESYTLEQLYKDMDADNITHSVVFPFNRKDADLIEDSLWLLERSRADGRIIPFLRFNPNTIERDRLKELLGKGFRGVKLHPNVQSFTPSDRRHFWIYEMIQAAGLPVLFHTKYMSGESSRPEHLLEVADAFPDLNIIMGHFFGDVFAVVEEVKKRDNVYVETSIYARVWRLKELVMNEGFDRVLFGSDAPYDNQHVAVSKILKAGLPEEAEARILFKNAQKLLKLE